MDTYWHRALNTNDTNLGGWWGRLYLSLVQGSVVEAAGSVQWAALLVIVVAGTVACCCCDMPVGDIC